MFIIEPVMNGILWMLEKQR